MSPTLRTPTNIHLNLLARSLTPELEKIKFLKDLGFDAMQFHDDAAVPELDTLFSAEIRAQAQEMKVVLDDQGLVAEFVAPRL
jgi:xylose isomerase